MNVKNIHHWPYLTLTEIYKYIGTTEKGLSAKEAEYRQSIYGENKITSKKRFELLRKFFNQLKNPVVLILLFAGIFVLFTGQILDAYVIFAVLVINLIISLVQEGRVSKAFQLLQKLNKSKYNVIRDGEKIRVSIEEITFGDVVALNTGDIVPADIRIIEGNNLEVNESSLTGEWQSVKKHKINITNKVSLAQNVNMLWRGTTILSGIGRGVVVSIGDKTVIGEIAKELEKESTKTPLQMEVQEFAKLIIILISISVAAIVFIGLIQNISLGNIILTSIAVAIAGIPSGLPASITFVLALGMQIILKKGGLPKDLYAVEALGSTNWILTDKTGTLTNANMVASSIFSLKEDEDVYTKKGINEKLKGIIDIAYMATNGREVKTSSNNMVETGSPIDKIFFNLYKNLEPETFSRKNKRLKYIPFDSRRKYSAALLKGKERNLEVFIGAPEVIIKNSTSILDRGKEKLLNTKDKEILFNKLNNKTKEGSRIIAIGTTNAVEGVDDNLAIIKNKELKFLAFFELKDTIRSDVKDSIKKIRDLNILVTMVTGDSSGTALQVAKSVGIVKTGDLNNVLIGLDVDKLSDEELYQRAKNIKVFARMTPINKLRLLKVLANNKEVVAMTGDGVNDAPALNKASIGISLASGSGVAREASDLILIKNSFTTIVNTILEGRKIIVNLKKILIYLLSTSFSEVILVGVGLLFTGMLPITPIQILWANIVEEAFISFAFAFEKGSNLFRVNREHRKDNKIINKNVKLIIISFALLIGAFLSLLYIALVNWSDLTQEQIQTIMFLGVSLDSIFLTISLKNLDKHIFTKDIFNNKFLIGAVLISLLILYLAFQIPILRELLSIVEIPYWGLFIIILSGIFHITVLEFIKIKLFKDKVKREI